jgi:hypothetical protein
MEGDDHGQRWTTRFLWKEALNCHIFTIAYLQYVKGKHLHAVVCSAGYKPQSVATKWHRQLYVNGNVTSRKSGFVESSGSSQGDGHNVQTRRKYIELAVA